MKKMGATDCETMAATLDFAAELSGGNRYVFAGDAGDLFTGGSWYPQQSYTLPGADLHYSGFKTPDYVDPSDQVRHFVVFMVLTMRYGAALTRAELSWHKGKWSSSATPDMRLGEAGIIAGAYLDLGFLSLNNIGNYIRNNICDSSQCKRGK